MLTPLPATTLTTTTTLLLSLSLSETTRFFEAVVSVPHNFIPAPFYGTFLCLLTAAVPHLYIIPLLRRTWFIRPLKSPFDFSRMGRFLVAGNKQLTIHMERPGKRIGPQAAAASSSTRVERKTMEKNRRNKMKSLYSMLNSLVPSNSNDQDSKVDSLNLFSPPVDWLINTLVGHDSFWKNEPIKDRWI